VTLSIAAIDSKRPKCQLRRTIITYWLVSIAAIAVDNIYAIFGHGVRSPAMTWMFLYPLLGGGLVFLLIKLLFPQSIKASGYRLFYNVYNSGIAALTTGSFLKGILDIAGTSSPYTAVYYITGGLFIAAGLIILLYIILQYKNKGNSLKCVN